MAASNYRVVCNLHAIMVYNAKARRWILSTAARRSRTAPIILPIPSLCNLSSDRKGYAISACFVAHPAMGPLARLIISTRKLSRIHRCGRATRLLRSDSDCYAPRNARRNRSYLLFDFLSLTRCCPKSFKFMQILNVKFFSDIVQYQYIDSKTLNSIFLEIKI